MASPLHESELERRGYDAQDQREIHDLAMAFIRAIQNQYGAKVDPLNAFFALAATASEIIHKAPGGYQGELLTEWEKASGHVRASRG